MTSSQVGKSEVILNVVGYSIEHDPAPILVLQPNAKPMGESFSKDRLAPMIRDTPSLQSKVKTAKGRDSDNTLMHKKFPGGHVTVAGASSPSSLASRPIRILLCDEVERYEATSEGDAVALANARTTTFWNRKRGYFSTPVVAGGRIHQLYEDSDQRKYFVPCPHCAEAFSPEFGHLKWEEDAPATGEDGATIRRAREAWFECPQCHSRIDDVERWAAVKEGYWEATAEFHGRAGFWLWQGISPWVKAIEIANAWLKALGRPDEEKTVKNTVLGLPWKEAGEAPDWEKLMARREEYRLGQVPIGVLFLTCGVDVQKTWLEGYVWGWGRGKQRWIIDHWRIEHNPYDCAAWNALTERLNRTYSHPSGPDLSILRMAVDTGYATQEVYRWVRQQGGGRVMATDGRDRGVALLGLPTQVDVTVAGRKIKHGCKLWPVNVSMAKSELYGLLGRERPAPGEPFPPGWVHFPADLDEEVFRQLTAEQLTTRLVKGYRKNEWQKTRERNEALDCANMARAGAAHVGIDRFGARQWKALEIQVGHAEPQPSQAEPAASSPPPPPALSFQPPKQKWFGDRGRNWFSR